MEIKKGDQYSKTFFISEKMINEFVSLTGDRNPIHLDEEYAKNTIFKKRIAPGFLVGSLIPSILGNEYPGIGTIYVTQTMRFINPIFINDNIRIRIEVIEITKNNWLKFRTECTNQFNKSVILGEATVIPPDNCILMTS